jgi:hypothetical protein
VVRHHGQLQRILRHRHVIVAPGASPASCQSGTVSTISLVNPAKPVTADDIAQIRRHIGELTKVGEPEIHEVVLRCTRARRQVLRSMPAAKPTLH